MRNEGRQYSREMEMEMEGAHMPPYASSHLVVFQFCCPPSVRPRPNPISSCPIGDFPRPRAAPRVTQALLQQSAADVRVISGYPISMIGQ